MADTLAPLIAESLLTQTPLWDVVVLNPNAEELVFTLWQDISISENFEGSEGSIKVPNTEVALGYLTEMVTDILYYRNHRLVYRHRVMRIDDSLSREGHEVTISTSSYEKLLAKRVLHNTVTMTGDQHDMAWALVNRTQALQTLHISRVPGRSGRPKRKVTIEHGKTIYEGIQELGEVENGFDWWIDASRQMHFQTPRRSLAHGFEWKWGQAISDVDRSSGMDDYASSVYVMGASQETTIPQGKGKPEKKYPPPIPVFLEVEPRPYGRWEVPLTYSDVVTQATLKTLGRHELGKVAVPRPTYNLGLQPAFWDTAVRPGSTFYLRVESPPRLNYRVLVRVEDLNLSLSAAGAEEIKLSVKAERAETQIASSTRATITDPDTPPAQGDVYADILPSMPYGSVEQGLTKTRTFVRAMDSVTSIIASLKADSLRHTKLTIGDETPDAAVDPLDDLVPVFYGFDGEVYRAGMWNPTWSGEWLVALFELSATPPAVIYPPLPNLSTTPVAPGVVPISTLTALGATQVRRFTPTSGTVPIASLGTYFQYNGTNGDGSDVVTGWDAPFELLNAGGTVLQPYVATIVAGNESTIPNMAAALFFNDNGTWRGQATLPQPIGEGDALRYVLFVTPEVPDSDDPSLEPSAATEQTLDTLRVHSYQLAVQPVTGAPIIVNGPKADLLGDPVGVNLPPLPTGAANVVWSLFDSNGALLGQYHTSVTTAPETPLTVTATVNELDVSIVIGGADPTPLPTVDWGDGTVNTSTTHTYATEGTWTITVTQPGHTQAQTTVDTTAVWGDGDGNTDTPVLDGNFDTDIFDGNEP